MFKPGGRAEVARALEEELDGPGAVAAVEDLLRLSVVLRDRRKSPETSEAVRDLLRASPAACALMRSRYVRVGGIDHQRRFAQREGREVVMTAPRTDSPRPDGALRPDNLFDPMQFERDRALRMARRKDPNGTR